MKPFNGQAKMSNGTGEHGWLNNVKAGYKRWILDKIGPPVQEERGNTIVMDIVKSIGCMFSVIGVITTMRWMLSSASSNVLLENGSLTSAEQCTDINHENCPWSHVFSDLTNRLHLMEMAFKEQVVARETIEREVNNQSDLNTYLNDKLALFNEKLENISKHYEHMELRVSQLASKLRYDEILGFILFLLVLTELILKLEPLVRHWLAMRGVVRASPSVSTPRKSNGKEVSVKKSSSGCSTPKHIFLRNEMCVLLFRKENNNIYTALIEAMLKNFTEVKLASNPFFIIENINDVKNVPPCKLYVVICDCEVSSGKTNGWDLHIATVKVLRTITVNVVVIVANDEGSKKMVAHSMYNENLRLVHHFDLLHDIASSGKLFSMWQEMSSHQMSHLRKYMRTVLNVRPSLTPVR
ncbi:uncharacterized protein [Argopecten irradians]|uniref:uncharacterized protein isoform X1 n=1 Tax=Argopecten irradians TaxID=31199 RepID=UPI00371FCF7D